MLVAYKRIEQQLESQHTRSHQFILTTFSDDHEFGCYLFAVYNLADSAYLPKRLYVLRRVWDVSVVVNQIITKFDECVYRYCFFD